MRELRAVRVSDDGKEILLTETSGTQHAATSSDPGFLLQADDRLRAMLRPRPSTTETRPESALTPREIQARLRAGDTAEEVAEAAGIPVARVARYEAPIAAERVRIVDEVRRATAPGPHRVSPGRQLGAVVDDRLADDGLDPVLAQWLARRRADGTWLVTVDLADHHAEWSWDGAARRVRAHDNGAQRLLSPSRSSAESLIAVAQATGVTVESAPRSPCSPARAARAAGARSRRRRVDGVRRRTEPARLAAFGPGRPSGRRCEHQCVGAAQGAGAHRADAGRHPGHDGPGRAQAPDAGVDPGRQRGARVREHRGSSADPGALGFSR